MKYAVIAQYEHQGYEQNEIISLHSSYELADKAAKGYSMRAIKEAPEGAKKGDNIRALEIAQGR